MKSRLPEIKGNWTFESSTDGSILYYPRGWGRAYVVPSEEKKREIEELLSVWLARRRTTFWLVRRICLPALIPMLLSFMILWIPPLWNRIPTIPLVIAFVIGPLLMAVGGLLVLACQLTMRF